MRVLHVIAAYKPAVIYGGPTMSAAMLCEELTRAGVTVNVYATTANGTAELPVNTSQPQHIDGVTVNYFKRITKDHTHFSPALLRSFWKNVSSFDVVHIHAWWNLVSVFACMIAIFKKVPVLVSPRGTLSPYSFSNRNTGPKKLIHQFFGEPYLNKSHIHTTSRHETDAILKLIKPLSITALPNFVKLSEPKQQVDTITYPQLKLLFFSRIEEKKGLDILLEALKLVEASYHLTIAGDGDAAYIKHLKELSISIAHKITWAGFYGDDKFDLIKQHDLLVLPSHDENFGNVVIESLSMGTAVLISEHVGLADYVSDNHLGWICKTNVRSVADAIVNISQNHREDLNKIRQTAPAIVRNDFTGDALVKKYIALYQQVAGK